MSSFYDLASLVMIPSGKKAGKVYSQKPLTTDGQLDFTRASTATRIGSDGKIEKTRTNLLLQSNTFNTTWASNNLTITSGQGGYDGTNDAYKLITTASGVGHRIFQSQSQSGVLTFSVYAKPLGYNFIFIYVGGKSAYFDLSNGSVGTTSGLINSNISSAGNDYYRCSITFSGITTSTVELYIANTISNYVFTGDGTSGILVQDAQLEQGLVATNVITTTTAAVSVGSVDNMPRLNYTPGSATSCPSLLLEPQRTNLVSQSEYFVGYWNLQGATSILDANAINPTGSLTSYILNSSATGSFKSLFKNESSIWDGKTLTMSCFAKKKTNDFIYFHNIGSASGSPSVYFNIGNGTLGSVGTAWSNAKIENYGNDWYKCSATITFGTNTNYLYISNSDGNDNLSSTIGSQTYIWGTQIEEGSYATSYIPTFGATVTRVADACSKTGVSGLIGTTEGVMFIDIQTPSTIQTNTTFSIGSGTSGEYAQLEIRTDLSINWRYRVGSVDYINSNVGSFTAGDRLKIAFAYKNLDSNLYLNGSSIATDTGTITTNAWSEVKYSNFTGTAKLEAEVNKTILFKTRLSNTQLAELTSLDS